MSLPIPSVTVKARDVQIECCLSCCPGRTWYGRKITPPSPSQPSEAPISFREALEAPYIPPRKSIVSTRVDQPKSSSDRIVLERIESSMDVLAMPKPSLPPLHPVRQASTSPERPGDIRIVVHKHADGSPSISIRAK